MTSNFHILGEPVKAVPTMKRFVLSMEEYINLPSWNHDEDERNRLYKLLSKASKVTRLQSRVFRPINYWAGSS